MKVIDQMQVSAKGIERAITLFDIAGVGHPYNLELAVAQDPMFHLPVALPLQYTVVEDKRVNAAPVPGSLIKVGKKKGEISAEQIVAPLSDIRIQLTDAEGRDVPGIVYGKVLPYSPRTSSGFPVRFTVVSPETAVFLRRLIAMYQ
ncbi:MAG TPA: hypothetical protein VMA09_06840 [Candidatus Binataceae bacterium]|nr:hypothetical protein [Candidatus Binataceae bacterium]